MVHIGVMVVPMRCKKKQDDCKYDDDKQDSLCEKVSYAFKNVADEVKHRLPVGCISYIIIVGNSANVKQTSENCKKSE